MRQFIYTVLCLCSGTHPETQCTLILSDHQLEPFPRFFFLIKMCFLKFSLSLVITCQNTLICISQLKHSADWLLQFLLHRSICKPCCPSYLQHFSSNPHFKSIISSVLSFFNAYVSIAKRKIEETSDIISPFLDSLEISTLQTIFAKSNRFV